MAMKTPQRSPSLVDEAATQELIGQATSLKSSFSLELDNKRPENVMGTECSDPYESPLRSLRKSQESGAEHPGFNPKDTLDLRALKEDLQLGPETQQKSHPSTSTRHRRPKPVPLTKPPFPIANPAKTILKKPRERFLEDPAPIREGVAPLKGAEKDGVPPDARWTKISRKLVNPEALEAGNERYETRDDFVIVLRVLSKDEIQEYAEKTRQIRG